MLGLERRGAHEAWRMKQRVIHGMKGPRYDVFGPCLAVGPCALRMLCFDGGVCGFHVCGVVTPPARPPPSPAVPSRPQPKARVYFFLLTD